MSAAGAGGGKPRTVYGDVLIIKESLARECIVDLADFKHVREKFVRCVSVSTTRCSDTDGGAQMVGDTWGGPGSGV